MAEPPGGRPRSRTVVLVLLAATIAAGLLSRSGDPRVPTFLAEHAGDALWTVAAYWALALLVPRAPIRALALAAFAVSLAVELSQLVRVDWLDSLRATRLGRLLLGQGWQAADLARYAVGALVAAFVDRVASAAAR